MEICKQNAEKINPSRRKKIFSRRKINPSRRKKGRKSPAQLVRGGLLGRCARRRTGGFRVLKGGVLPLALKMLCVGADVGCKRVEPIADFLDSGASRA